MNNKRHFEEKDEVHETRLFQSQFQKLVTVWENTASQFD